ncbi:hypothetical protein AAG570_006273 [Ranatra chinensis]|uniref:Uncharacterized protein n=1 Tax=Ranatra chinensis TaxID=642074 RepID=A0ABD0Z445_9HEMI
MDELKHYNIRVKQKYAELVKERSEKIRSLFPVRLSEVWHGDSNPSTFAYFKLEPDPIDHPIDASLISKVQAYPCAPQQETDAQNIAQHSVGLKPRLCLFFQLRVGAYGVVMSSMPVLCSFVPHLPRTPGQNFPITTA